MPSTNGISNADPEGQSHKAPIEVIIVGFFGLVAGPIGVALARAIQRLTGAR